MIDVSQTGARLLIEGSLEGLDLKEFFLLLSSTGLAYRRESKPPVCRRAHIRPLVSTQEGASLKSFRLLIQGNIGHGGNTYVLDFAGAPRPTKIGTTVSPWPYDAVGCQVLQSAFLRRPAILRYASWRTACPILLKQWSAERSGRRAKRVPRPNR
jgi:hypothetical protein